MPQLNAIVVGSQCRSNKSNQCSIPLLTRCTAQQQQAWRFQIILSCNFQLVLCVQVLLQTNTTEVLEVWGCRWSGKHCGLISKLFLFYLLLLLNCLSSVFLAFCLNCFNIAVVSAIAETSLLIGIFKLPELSLAKTTVYVDCPKSMKLPRNVGQGDWFKILDAFCHKVWWLYSVS